MKYLKTFEGVIQTFTSSSKGGENLLICSKCGKQLSYFGLDCSNGCDNRTKNREFGNVREYFQRFFGLDK